MTLTGVVTGVDFINPHSWVYFTVTDEAGEEIEVAPDDISRGRCDSQGSRRRR